MRTDADLLTLSPSPYDKVVVGQSRGGSSEWGAAGKKRNDDGGPSGWDEPWQANGREDRETIGGPMRHPAARRSPLVPVQVGRQRIGRRRLPLL